jgi:hypothetical protein
MTLSVSPRDMAQKQTLSQAVQGTKPTATDVTGGAPRQQNTTETTPPASEATKPEEKKDDFLSPKFAALARQEKQVQAARQKLKAEKEAFEREREARLNGYIPKEDLRKNTLSALESAGLSYDDLTKQLLEAPQGQIDPTVRAAQAKIAELEAKLNQITQKQEESQTAAYKQALDTIRHKVSGLVDSSPGDYEMIKALDQSEAVVALIEETFKAEGYVMSEEDAAREVEEHLLEEAVRMSALEKVKKKLAPAPATETPTSQVSKPGEEKQPIPQQQQIKTLTNAIQSAPRGLTAAERRQRAILAAQGKLNN